MRSFLSYLGGKSLLAPKIIPLIPEHECYVEVFAGAAWLFWMKPESKIEILNDINSDLVNLYRCVKNHLVELVRCMQWTLTSRDEYNRFKMQDPSTLTDIQRAVRFYYLLKNSYASKLDFNSFNISTTHRPRLNLLRIEQELSEAHMRLGDVYIENRHYKDVIERFDKPHTFMYLDPPYAGCEDYYGKGIFSPEDFNDLAGILSKCQSKFIMSINDTPEIRRIFAQFNIREVPTTYSAAGGDKRSKVVELLIMNYKP